MLEKCINIEPHKLYPLTSLSAIAPNTLREMLETMRENEEYYPIKVINYKGNWCVYEGIYAMLAANILKKETIPAQIIERESLPFWKDDCNVMETMRNIGKSGLYDFEAIGNFTYEKYPKEYIGD